MKGKRGHRSSSEIAHVLSNQGDGGAGTAAISENLLMQQLHQVREELELYFLKCLDLDADLQATRVAGDDARRETEALKMQLLHMQSELAAAMNRPRPQLSTKGFLLRVVRATARLGRLGLSKRRMRDAQIAVIRESAWFDAAWYLKTYPDVREAGLEPATHFHNFGWKEARNPGPHFNTGWYLRANPDVAAAGIDPLSHYLEHGAREGRHPFPN